MLSELTYFRPVRDSLIAESECNTTNNTNPENDKLLDMCTCLQVNSDLLHSN
jgi:hypothetical protein